MAETEECRTRGALSGIRVLDLSRILAGPWATQLLADLGAEVIKVEQPLKGDDTRHWGIWVTDGEDRRRRISDYYLCANRNKKSVCVNIASAEGQELIRQLACRSDILIENFRVGQLKHYGLDYASLSALNERLIYCSITGFGQDGPYARRAGYDFVIQGMSGLMSITGRPDNVPGGGPMKAGVAMADVMTGLYAANAVQAALVARQRTGRGQYVDLSLLDVQLACLANYPVGYLATGEVPSRNGNAHSTIVPYQDFETADGRIILAIGNDGQFVRFCEAADLAWLAEDPAFRTNDDRRQNRDRLISCLTEKLRTKPTREWVALLEARAVPCGPINDIAQAFDCPQVKARRMKVEMPGTGQDPCVLVANPIRLSDTPVEYRTAPPALGGDTDAVLRDLLGATPAQLEGWHRSRVV